MDTNDPIADLTPDEIKRFANWAFSQDRIEVTDFDDTNTVEVNWAAMRQQWDNAGKPAGHNG